jgi:hypothetical protein
MPVSVQGLSWSGAGIWTGVVLLVAAIVKAWPHLRKLSNESDASLRHDLMERIDKLEKQLSDERRDCDKQMSELQGEMRGLRDKIDGLVRQLVAYQVAEARSGVIPLSPQMMRAVDSLENIARAGDAKP